MNRYITDGLVRDAAAGKNIVIVAKTLRHAEHELRLAIEAAPNSWTRTSAANGNKYAEHLSGGTIRPVAATTSLRGRDPDVLLVLDFRDMDERQQAEVTPFIHMRTEVLLNS